MGFMPRRPAWAFWPAAPTQPVGVGDRLRMAASALVAVSLVGFCSSYFLGGTGLATLIASMGASSVILFAVPGSPMAQPWPLVGSHLLCAAVGVTCARWLPDPQMAGGAAVGLSIFLMVFTRTLHPPGGATTLVPVLGGAALHDLGYRFLLTPVALNVSLLFLLALVLNRLLNRQPYPARMTAKKEEVAGGDLRPMERLGLNAGDLRLALAEMNVFVDVSEAELGRIYDAASLHAWRREFGELTCGRLMSRVLVTVEFATELDEAWTLLSGSGVKALPVLDRGRHVLGVVTQMDFIAHAGMGEAKDFAGRLRRLLARTPTVTSAKPEVVGQIMTAPAVTVRENSHIAALVPLMSDRGLHHIPIVDEEDKLVGMIAQSDLIAALYRGAGEV